MADTIYFDDDYVASGYTVYTAYASATLSSSSAVSNPTFSLGVEASVYTAADLTGYVLPDYWATGYVSSVKYGSATLQAINSTLAYGDDWTLTSAGLSVAASLSASADIEIYGTGTLDSETTTTIDVERQRNADSDLTLTASQSTQADVYFYAGATLTATASISATPTRSRRGQAQNLFVDTTPTVQGNAEYDGIANLNNAINANIYATYQVGLLSNPTTWDESGVTWSTYPGGVWGANTYRLYAQFGGQFLGGKSPGLARETLEARTDISANGVVGQTKYFSATLSSSFSVDVEYSRHRFNTQTLDATTDVQADAEFIVAPSLTLAAEALVTQANAIVEVSGGATLDSEFIIDILASGEAYLFPQATFDATVTRLRGSPSTLAAQVTTEFDGIVGHTELASSSLSVDTQVDAIGNAIFGGNGTFNAVDTVVGFGRILGFDPYREYTVDIESRYIRVLPETSIYAVNPQDALNTVINEYRGIVVSQETRHTKTIDTTYEQRRETA